MSELNENASLGAFSGAQSPFDGASGTSLPGGSAAELPTAGSFDMDTAWLRRAQADLQGFVTRFAMLAETALPHHARVVKIREGFFKKTERVGEIAIAFDTEVYKMTLRDARSLDTTVERRVRGVVISNRPVEPHAWMTGLMAAVKAQTEHSRALSDMLRAL